jgi:hypothetical protein
MTLYCSVRAARFSSSSPPTFRHWGLGIGHRTWSSGLRNSSLAAHLWLVISKPRTASPFISSNIGIQTPESCSHEQIKTNFIDTQVPTRKIDHVIERSWTRKEQGRSGAISADRFGGAERAPVQREN